MRGPESEMKDFRSQWSDLQTGFVDEPRQTVEGADKLIGRRFHDNEVKPHYRDGDIIELINVATCAAFMVTNLVTKHFGFKEDSQRVTQEFAKWSADRKATDHE